uniref:Drug sensory protein A n=1 Tax=Nemalion vermiculare TaxID=935621 RepID=UPI002580B3FA|nr:Drug sensory protein A [Nemalion vermiculare]WGV34326.1 Drug sensory protein A [Nemalion vermiculare]
MDLIHQFYIAKVIVTLAFILFLFLSIISSKLYISSSRKFFIFLRQSIDCISDRTLQTWIHVYSNIWLVTAMKDCSINSNHWELYEKKYVEKLIVEKSKLETLVSIIADGVVLLDEDLKVLFFNQSASKIFKSLATCKTGTDFMGLVPNEVRSQLEPMLNQILINRGYCDFKNSNLQLKVDSVKTLHIVITAVLDHDSQKLTGIGLIIQDITNQIGLNEAKAQFISNVSHELRTPLFNIRSFLETLSDYRDSLTEKQKVEFLEIASQETQRLTCLVNDVLDLSRLESDFSGILELIELHEVVPQVVQTYQLRANTKKVQLSFLICPSVVSINAYPNLITQVLSNLIGNSLKFTRTDGRILLKVYTISSNLSSQSRTRSKVRIEIIDEGTGIDEYDFYRIFDRFVRLENNVHTLEGTGLGLSIVKNIVEKHNSYVQMYSELDLGSSFWFDLPLLEKKN